MAIFRAVERASFNPEKVYERHPGARLPGNVPYLIDNIWECARPQYLPSRRHAVYASPTPELALLCASANALGRDKYMACEVHLATPPEKLFQLSVWDARDHRDLKRLQKLVHAALGQWGQRPFDGKLAFAPLFLPGMTAKEIADAANATPELGELLTTLTAAATMWSESPDPSKGEVIFELEQGNTYSLTPV